MAQQRIITCQVVVRDQAATVTSLMRSSILSPPKAPFIFNSNRVPAAVGAGVAGLVVVGAGVGGLVVVATSVWPQLSERYMAAELGTLVSGYKRVIS